MRPHSMTAVHTHAIDVQTIDARAGVLWGDKLTAVDPAYAYYSPVLWQHLISAGNRSDAWLITSSAQHTHFPEAPYRISTQLHQGGDEFINTYKPEQWTFEYNFKRSQTRDFYANDIVRDQYEIIASKENFYGVLPSVIKNSAVSNYYTLQATATLASNTPQLLRVFLEQTPNGKRTQRVLDDFAMKAQSVHRSEEDLLQFVDFLICVVPK